uniref:Uncharacterized protein n=1 Tax=Romanomermis culicivorax TaxID=13658 RepID=A0A915K9T6_ROMCU
MYNSAPNLRERQQVASILGYTMCQCDTGAKVQRMGVKVRRSAKSRQNGTRAPKFIYVNFPGFLSNISKKKGILHDIFIKWQGNR